jgi:uncharacterized NAD(P)/FAD-binding protein YdhS
MTNRVAIIGAGLSGTLTAVNLLSQSGTPLSIYLIEQTGSFGPGLAYSPPSEAFKLNVRAKAMGALPSDPEGFFRWLKKMRPSAQANDFVPRSLYGRYLNEILEQSKFLAKTHTLTQISQEVFDIEQRGSGGFSITLKDGDTLYADTCVLALGNIPRTTIAGTSDLSALRPPFATESYADISTLQEIFILGSSLTAVDVILECERRGFTGSYTVLSRHGRFPLAHEENHTDDAALPADWHTLASVPKLLKLIRGESQRLASSQPVFDAMRPNIQSMWRHFTHKEKRRFLRHLQPLWEIHRHRIPKEHHNTLSTLQQNGRLTITCGSLTAAERSSQGIQISFAVKGSPPTQQNFDAAFLCVGPEGDVSRMTSPLVQNLLRRGLVKPGPLKLGIVDSAPQVWVIGPLQREELWEITAARELREEAERIATIIAHQSTI